MFFVTLEHLFEDDKKALEDVILSPVVTVFLVLPKIIQLSPSLGDNFTTSIYSPLLYNFTS